MKRRTIQRSLVLTAVTQLRNHPTAEEVYQYAARHNPNISRGTVYRNLSQLADEGAIRRIPVPNASDRFDFTTDAHYHIVCRGCGRFEDAPLPYNEAADEQVSRTTGWQCEGHDIIFQGLCPACIEKKETDQQQEERLT